MYSSFRILLSKMCAITYLNINKYFTDFSIFHHNLELPSPSNIRWRNKKRKMLPTCVHSKDMFCVCFEFFFLQNSNVRSTLCSIYFKKMYFLVLEYFCQRYGLFSIQLWLSNSPNLPSFHQHWERAHCSNIRWWNKNFTYLCLLKKIYVLYFLW